MTELYIVNLKGILLEKTCRTISGLYTNCFIEQVSSYKIGAALLNFKKFHFYRKSRERVIVTLHTAVGVKMIFL